MSIKVEEFSKVRLKIEFCYCVNIFELSTPCILQFRNITNCEIENVYDKKGNKVMVNIKYIFNKVIYRIIITNQEFIIYADNYLTLDQSSVKYGLNKILSILKNVIDAFSQIDKKIVAQSVTLDKFYANGKELMRASKNKIDVKIVKDDNIGLLTIFNKNTDGYLILRAYMIRDSEKFLDSIHYYTHKLYSHVTWSSN